MRKTMILTLASLLVIGGCGDNAQRAGSSTVGKPVEPLSTPGNSSGNASGNSPDKDSAQKTSPVAPATTPPTVSSPDPGRTIATVNGRPITEGQLMQPLVEGYGLNILLSLGLLEEAKNLASNAGVKVSPADVEQELDATLRKAFPDAEKPDYPNLLGQLLEKQGRSRAEFDIVIETNAYLRKVAEPVVKGKITEKDLNEAFKALYGETVRVRHIELSNLREVAEAKRRIAAGEAFEKVAREMSRNARTKEIGGQILPFSRNASNVPDVFKSTSFDLKVGEVSDAVQIEGAYHLIKLEERIAPRAIKFEDIKESLREDLQDKLLQSQVVGLRNQLKQQLRTMRVTDPLLAEQFKKKLAEEDGAVTGQQDVKKKLDDERIARIRAAATQASTRPAVPATLPTEIPGGELRPPATQPVVPTPGPAK